MKAKILTILIVLTVLVSCITGCTQKDSYLIDILKILPDDIVAVDCVDIKAMAEDPDLEVTYNRQRDRVITMAEDMVGIDVSFCVYAAQATAERGYLYVYVGDFDLETVRDALTNNDYERDEYTEIEIWTKDPLSVTFLKKKIVIGITETVKDIIHLKNNKGSPWYDDREIKSVVDKLPAGVESMVFGPDYMPHLLEVVAGGFCLQNLTRNEGVLDIAGWFKFESEADAEANLDEIENNFEFYIELTGDFEVTQLNSQLQGEFIEITGEMVIISEY